MSSHRVRNDKKAWLFIGYLFVVIVGGIFLLFSTGILAKESEEPNGELSPTDISKSGWVILHDGLALMGEGLPLDCVDQIQDYSQKGEYIKQVEFFDVSSCIILIGRNGYYASLAPDELTSELTRLSELGEEIKQVLVTPNLGWVILYGRNGYSSKNLPEDLLVALSKLNDTNEEINRIAMEPDFGWIVFYNSNNWTFSGIPREITNKMREFKANGEELSVFFTKDFGYIIFRKKGEDYNGYYSSGIPLSLVETLESLQRTNIIIQSISFPP